MNRNFGILNEYITWLVNLLPTNTAYKLELKRRMLQFVLQSLQLPQRDQQEMIDDIKDWLLKN